MRNKDKIQFDHRFPRVKDLREKARNRIPGFAFDYLDGGCNEEVNLHRNTQKIREVILQPDYLSNFNGADLSTSLFGHTYSAPFGISPIGLQGLIWPGASRILAKAAFEQNIPFILSTVATTAIEEISEITEGKAWFQFYHPASDEMRDDLIKRAEAAGVEVLVLLCDVPTFGYRPKEIRSGLSMPPRLTLRNILQMIARPKWTMATLKEGAPRFANLDPYMPGNLNLSQLGQFMDQTFDKRLNEEKIGPIRDRWKGKLVLKGVASSYDMKKAIKLGMDGVIISNHGGRQLDAGEATISTLKRLAWLYGDQTVIMMDGGLRSGPDIARTMASGANFTFIGRPFMYGVAALGREGGMHTIAMLRTQLQQIMDQLGCPAPSELYRYLLNDN
ncbi:alpha-hydroxy acid oxidase [Lentiprolixibacter aurantiacus]|uniref:Alpha-hydroxy acid oxidase n=1 Tax=Lentiprolixibacter aurantiacus TaxID=2993939 RepID=A0AAE3SPI1_9FLAO|nr:alpha-hydroxy acid oxidase [Lentiprolixibacter aurantiacus]MCX2720615.1 alpha-hydroxy acid oxidase [Lentiprolixibacter aurantiacus]